jgi:putative transposase
MNRFRRMKALQKFASVHNLFNQERHLISSDQYRESRSAALAEWRSVMG